MAFNPSLLPSIEFQPGYSLADFFDDQVIMEQLHPTIVGEVGSRVKAWCSIRTNKLRTLAFFYPFTVDDLVTAKLELNLTDHGIEELIPKALSLGLSIQGVLHQEELPGPSGWGKVNG